MCVTGHDNRPDHAARILALAGDMLQAARKVTLPLVSSEQTRFLQPDVAADLSRRRIRVRMGVHTGSAFTGVVGNTMPRFCFFGDTISAWLRCLGDSRVTWPSPLHSLLHPPSLPSQTRPAAWSPPPGRRAAS